MNAVLPAIREIEAEMVALRHQIHAHPELSLEEHGTSDLVAERLAAWGYEVRRGMGGTGVVGHLKNGKGTRRLGLRADMDALPIEEQTGLPYASQNPGKMHACGHDGHTAMLLTAARHLAQTRNFSGSLNLIFQPAEERFNGADRMIKDGLFREFPCDRVFALHNTPGQEVGLLGFRSGGIMASSDTVQVRIVGKGGHGAMPHRASDPVVAAAHVILALQSIVSRNVAPGNMAVITVGAIHAGTAPNVIPDEVKMSLTVRALEPAMQQMLHDRLIEVITAQAVTLGCRAEVDYQWGCPAVVNDAEATAFARQVAVDVFGEAGLMTDLQPSGGSEDFSFMLQQVPGCYFRLGNGTGETHATGGCSVHNPGYDFNDAALPIGATYWVKLAEAFLSEA